MLNLIDYNISQILAMADIPFDALIAAAMRKADSDNLRRLQMCFPATAADLQSRYNGPGGSVDSDFLDEIDTERAWQIAKNYLKNIERYTR